jgi:transcriptional regulator with GAF, ATPase, and Fis domain
MQPALDETIIGAEEGLKAVIQRVNQVAPSNASVLILGETGSGKEVIARAIHERSNRNNKAFIRVNCGALPPELIDSELFGHEKGSFTGAVTQRRGWFERANGGTLLLDEVGELPMAAQIRLLRVLQDGIIQRVGSEHTIAVNVRVIAATHRDLPNMVQEGQFREDLWYRLAVFPIILPALHERPKDIKPLALHFIHRAAQRLGLPTPALKANDLLLLKAYRWPGNVRELSSVLERAVILGKNKGLDIETALGTQSLRKFSSAPTPPKTKASEQEPITPLDAVIRQHIERALTHSQGRVDGPQGAALLLGLNTSTLRGKLRKYDIDPKDFKTQ